MSNIHVQNCRSSRFEDVHEVTSVTRPPDVSGTYYNVIRYWYCKHEEIIANQFQRSYWEPGEAG